MGDPSTHLIRLRGESLHVPCQSSTLTIYDAQCTEHDARRPNLSDQFHLHHTFERVYQLVLASRSITLHGIQTPRLTVQFMGEKQLDHSDRCFAVRSQINPTFLRRSRERSQGVLNDRIAQGGLRRNPRLCPCFGLLLGRNILWQAFWSYRPRGRLAGGCRSSIVDEILRSFSR